MTRPAIIFCGLLACVGTKPRPLAPLTSGPAGPILEGRVVWTGALPAEPPVGPPGHASTCPASAPSEPTGVIVGRDGGVANAVVWIEAPGLADPAVARPPPALKYRRCHAEPRVLVAHPRERIMVANEDNVLHNPHAFLGKQTFFNQAVLSGQTSLILRALPESGVLRIGCRVHPWELAHVVIVPRAVYRVTDTTGRFRFDDVPAEDITLRVWHHGQTNGPPYDRSRRLRLTSAATTTVVFDVGSGREPRQGGPMP